jgi:hypothetical protein
VRDAFRLDLLLEQEHSRTGCAPTLTPRRAPCAAPR